MRQYSRDWIRKQGDFNVDTRFQKLSGKSWFDDDGKETPLAGVIVLQWWPQPKLTEMEKFEREVRARQEARRREREED